jgi:glucose dehydrogenase
MTRRWTTLAVTVAAVLAVGTTTAQRSFEPVTDAMLVNPDPADWLMWRRTIDSWGYSPLDAIDRGNVARLALAWSVDVDAAPSQEGIPLVYDGVLYFPGPSDVTTAYEAATGTKLWEHRRALPADLGQFVPFPQTNRNLAIYGRRSSSPTAPTTSSTRSTP